jgi:hypothetical protein
MLKIVFGFELDEIAKSAITKAFSSILLQN